MTTTISHTQGIFIRHQTTYEIYKTDKEFVNLYTPRNKMLQLPSFLSKIHSALNST